MNKPKTKEIVQQKENKNKKTRRWSKIQVENKKRVEGVGTYQKS